MKCSAKFSVLAVLACIIGLSSAFAPVSHSTSPVSSNTNLSMAPKFDPISQRWETIDEADMEGSYGPIGSLIRAGPKPFIIRLISQDQYEQAVLKYMANENVGRKEAQGNMDAYFENPNDWAYQKNIERNGGYKKDYANANTSPKQLVLSGIWAGIVVFFFNDLINGITSGKYY